MLGSSSTELAQVGLNQEIKRDENGFVLPASSSVLVRVVPKGREYELEVVCGSADIFKSESLYSTDP